MHKDTDWITKVIEEVGNTAMSHGEYWRASYTKEDDAAVCLLKKYMEEAGMDTYFDAVGNLFGRLQGKSDDLIMSGSHRDTVRQGGKYDGILGVLTALKAAASLYAQYGSPKKTLEIAAMCEEESSRFPISYLGSHHICGSFSQDLLQTRDYNGITLSQALTEAGYQPCPLSDGRKNLRHFIELHIEQGGVLEEKRKQVGLVSSVVGLYSWEITFSGHQNHAGTTPMYMRKDPMPVAAQFICELYQWAYHYMNDMVCTVGKITAQPGNGNVIADSVMFTVDIRSENEERLQQADIEIRKLAEKLTGKIGISVLSTSEEPPVHLDKNGLSLLEKLAKERQFAYHIMPSGAGHDSQVIAQKYPVNMIFVPSVDGISHNTAEYTRPEDIEAGYFLLRDFLKELAW